MYFHPALLWNAQMATTAGSCQSRSRVLLNLSYKRCCVLSAMCVPTPFFLWIVLVEIVAGTIQNLGNSATTLFSL